MNFSNSGTRLFLSIVFIIALVFCHSKQILGNNLKSSNNSEIKNYPIEKILSYKNNDNEVRLNCSLKNSEDKVDIRITFPFIDGVAVNIKASDEKFKEAQSVKYSLTDQKDSLIISTDSISIHLQKNPYSLSVHRNDLIISSRQSVVIDSSNKKNIQVVTGMDLTEHFYGFGEKFNGLDQRGKKVVMELDDAYKSTDNKTYKSIPFFLSSKGYGVLVNSPKRVVFHMGDNSSTEYTFENPDSLIEYYIFTNSSPIKIIEQYTSITGRTRLAPKWSLEPWLSRRQMTGWNNPAAAEFDVDMIIKEGFRLGVILWEGIRSMFSGNHSLQMNKLSDKWHSMGLKQVSWGYTGHIQKEMVDWNNVNKNYFLHDNAGSFILGGRGKGNVYINPFNPEAMRWWNDTAYKYRFKSENGKSTPTAWNLDGVKIDFSELFPKDDSNVKDVDKSFGLHNQHAVFFSKQIYDWLQETRPEGGITWVRGGGIGLQTVGFTWGGDRGRTFQQLLGTIRASLAISVCGVSLVGHDLGGYRGDDSTEARKVYIRGAQYAAFSPGFHDHGSAPAPWEQDEYGKENYRFYSRVRYNLIPYLYHYVKVSHYSGVPLMRTLYMHNPKDENTFEIEDEYYLGEELLVAPVITELNEREIYLPEGEWIDFWNSGYFKGKQKINYKTPLNRIPVFARAGTILPLDLNDALQIGGIFPQEKKNDLLLTFRLFEGKDSEFIFYGKHEIQIRKKKTTNSMVVNVENIDNDFALIIDRLLANKITVNGKEINSLENNEFIEANNGWRFDNTSAQTLIKIKHIPNVKNYEIKLKQPVKKFPVFKTVELAAPEIVQAVGWDQSAEIFFKHVKDAESYTINYWAEESNDKKEIKEVAYTPVIIPDLENGKKYNIAICAKSGGKLGKSSVAKTFVPAGRKAFFKLQNGEGFINSGHYLKKETIGDSDSVNYTYGLFSNGGMYNVWAKVKSGESHYLYYQWYKIGKIELERGKNYFALCLVKELISSMLYFSVNSNESPAFKDEIEAYFFEDEVQIVNEKILGFNQGIYGL